jgi:hypothetical protein
VETLQVWHERLGHQNKHHVMKVLKQHGINVKANKEFCDVCFGKGTSAELQNLDKLNKHSWRTD